MRDFGDILAEFEGKPKKSGKTCSKVGKVLEKWLDAHNIEDKDAQNVNESQRYHINYKKLKIDERIDLHLLNKEEALKCLEDFFEDAIKKRYKKVLIIHGKGKHSQNEAVLGKMVRKFVENHPNAGKSGYASNAEGGSGATWVILKNIK